MFDIEYWPCLALPTVFHIFSNYVPVEERSRSFSYLIAFGSVGQTFAALVGEKEMDFREKICSI